MQLIGFIGLRRSGKDTAAAALIAQGYTPLKFASGLKAMLRALLRDNDISEPMIDRMIDGDLKEVVIPLLGCKSPRYLMQTLGTEWGRNQVAKNFWVDLCIEKARRCDRAVITDCRFPNEALAIQRAGGFLVRVTRPGLVVDSHPSEALIQTIPYHFEIENTGTIAELHDRVRQLVALINEEAAYELGG